MSKTTTIYHDIEKIRRVLNWFKDGRAEPEDHDAPEVFERIVTALMVNERLAMKNDASQTTEKSVEDWADELRDSMTTDAPHQVKWTMATQDIIQRIMRQGFINGCKLQNK